MAGPGTERLIWSARVLTLLPHFVRLLREGRVQAQAVLLPSAGRSTAGTSWRRTRSTGGGRCWLLLGLATPAVPADSVNQYSLSAGPGEAVLSRDSPQLRQLEGK